MAGAAPKLAKYRAMRDFSQTEEPSGHATVLPGWSFVVQKHDATRLHYDFRLELDGVLLSWAVPKGPSLDPKDKRLAVQTEDHPLDYRDFEGTIPEGQYGGGAVIVWDRGTWTPIGDPREGMKKGRLDFSLAGEKLHGRFVLVHTKRGGKKQNEWLLMKRTDEHVRTGAASIVEARPESILTGRTVEKVATEDDVEPEDDERAPLPPFGELEPQLATLVDAVPVGDEWIYEIKYDGYRALGYLDRGKVRMASRRGKDWTEQFAPIAAALATVRAKTAVFDGEVAYVLPDGRTDFQELQNALGGGPERARLVYFVFDLLHYDGVDLTDKPLAYRKEKLRTILAGEGPPLRMGDHMDDDGEAFLEEACKRGLEGIIAKRADRPYSPGRSREWVKVKCQARQELVIVGFTQPKGTRKGIGALLLGVRDERGLRYAGKVGTGFSEASLRDLAKKLKTRVVDEPPVVSAPRMAGVTWVRPDLVCQVRFTEWTSEGVLRHPAFEGLRDDKPAKDVVVEVEKPAPAAKAKAKPPRRDGKVEVDGVVISHPERVLGSGITKQGLAEYHAAVAPFLVPYAARRPLMLLRAPTEGERFVQKHANRGMQGAKHVAVGHVEGEEVLSIDSAKGAVELAQFAAVELHGWGSRLPKWDRPDWIVMDLDPDEGLGFAKVIDAALEVRDALAGLGLESWVKTTGGKGLHVVVPLAPKHDWDVIRTFTEGVARALEAQAPARYVANMAKRARKGRIFVDYLRNAQGATAILPYSPRAREGMPVALPVDWKDLRKVDPQAYTVATVPGLLAKRRQDPWDGFLACKQTLSKAVLDALG
jgi:bifunctional non-homologous end joining protein LigD